MSKNSTSADLTLNAGRRSTREHDRDMPAVIASRQHVCSSGKLLPVGDSARKIIHIDMMPSMLP
jgi:hypothetical protein